MSYPKIPDYNQLISRLTLYSQLKHEYGAKGIVPILAEAERSLTSVLARLQRLPIDEKLAAKEPNDYQTLCRLRPKGPRRLWATFNRRQYAPKVEGALLARMAGCTLGAPVEGWSIEKMEALARQNSMAFPPTDYWVSVPDPYEKRYGVSPRESYTRHLMKGVPVDDDIAYTLLGLLVLETCGPNFTTQDVGQIWLEYLPRACTAEAVALNHLKAGLSGMKCGERNNPYCEWIGADIRSDPWGYVAPGWPERAARMGYRDAVLSHRRQGIYGEMFFSAAISAAFAVDHPAEALKIGLTEIPRDCALAQAIRWALHVAPHIKNYREARAAVDKRFAGMHKVHTINNACLTVFGLTIGGTDVTKVISETVAMGLDNDCTAATAGSLVGAIVGKKGIPRRWYRRFDNTVHSYLTGKKTFTISGLVRRFTTQAERLFNGP